MQQTTDSAGVYFDKEAYASFWLRLLVDLIDVSLLLTLSVTLAIISIKFIPPPIR